MVEAYHVLRFGVITGLAILIAGFLISILMETTAILWFGIYTIVATPLLSVAIICARNIRSRKNRSLGLLALLEILVIILYVLVTIHAL